MKTFQQLINETLQRVNEIFPWDLEEMLENNKPLLIDVREPDEYAAMHIENSLNVPRGILETSCEWNFDETIPELVKARDSVVILICRSGNRSVFTADVMQQMGYKEVYSLKTGLKGWADNEYPLVNSNNNLVDVDAAEEFFISKVRKDQLTPQNE